MRSLLFKGFCNYSKLSSLSKADQHKSACIMRMLILSIYLWSKCNLQGKFAIENTLKLNTIIAVITKYLRLNALSLFTWSSLKNTHSIESTYLHSLDCASLSAAAPVQFSFSPFARWKIISYICFYFALRTQLLVHWKAAYGKALQFLFGIDNFDIIDCKHEMSERRKTQATEQSRCGEARR